MSAADDLHHSAQPAFTRVKTQIKGRLLLSRCAVTVGSHPCNRVIWRTASRFLWQHSTPPRAERIGQ